MHQETLSAGLRNAFGELSITSTESSKSDMGLVWWHPGSQQLLKEDPACFLSLLVQNAQGHAARTVKLVFSKGSLLNVSLRSIRFFNVEPWKDAVCSGTLMDLEDQHLSHSVIRATMTAQQHPLTVSQNSFSSHLAKSRPNIKDYTSIEGRK